MELERGWVGWREVGWAAMGSYCTPRVVYIAFVYFSEKPPGVYIIYITKTLPTRQLNFLAHGLPTAH